MTVNLLSREEWRELSENAHLICFNEIRSSDLDRIDFAILVAEGELPIQYITCYEHDKTTVYIQHGGSFPHGLGALVTFRGYLKILKALEEMGFERAHQLVENTNKAMLKAALKVGWLITGIKVHQGKVLVEHTLEFKSKLNISMEG